MRATTAASYRGAVAKLQPLIGAIPLQQLTRQDVRGAYEALATTPGRGGRMPAVKTVHNVHLALVAALNAAVDDGLARTNAAHKAHKAPRDDQRPEMKVWTNAQLRAFLSASEEDQLGPLFRLLAMTGARRGEVLGTRWEDLDLDAGTYRVVQHLTRIRVEDQDVWGFRAPKTRAGRRTIDIDPTTVAMLKAHRAGQARPACSWARASASRPTWSLPQADSFRLNPDSVSSLQFFERLGRWSTVRGSACMTCGAPAPPSC